MIKISEMRWIFFFFLLGIVEGTYAQEKKFVIDGKIPELNEGTMVLIVNTLHGPDTIARAAIHNGDFHMEGKLTEPLVALIAVENFSGGFTLLLDTDAPYSMELYKDGRHTIEGGALQTALNTHLQLVASNNKEIKRLKEAIGQAVQEKHFRTKKELEEKLQKVKQKAEEKLSALLEKNNDNIFAAYIQTQKLEQVVDLNILKSQYALLTDKARETYPGRLLAARIAGLEKVNVSAIAPDFVLITPEGHEVSLYKVKGKLKIIDFWASWCGPCRMENPNMVRLYNDYKEEGLAIISISLDNKKESWVKAIQKDGMSWIHVSDLKGWNSEVVKNFGVDAVPYIYVLDENNRILAKQLRGEKLRAFVSGYLRGKD